jgi:hypothetical protein
LPDLHVAEANPEPSSLRGVEVVTGSRPRHKHGRGLRFLVERGGCMGGIVFDRRLTRGVWRFFPKRRNYGGRPIS